MSEARHLSEGLDEFMTNAENGWFMPIQAAIQGLNAVQAARRPAEGFNSVWGVINHLRYWNEIMLLRLAGESMPRQDFEDSSGWPAPADRPEEAAWKQACDQLMSVHNELVFYISSLEQTKLEEAMAPGRARRWQVIQGILAHNSYHTCEIISIRHLQGLWLERA
jgi:uncharacterized damage-inducible protein DinB